MVFICTNSPYVKIWANIFPTTDLYFENSLHVYNLKFILRILCNRKYFLYFYISGFSADLTLYQVVYWRVHFYLSSTITHLHSNISVFIPWRRLSVYVAYPLIVLLTLTLIINLTSIKYWDSPIKKYIPISNIWIPESSLQWMVGGYLVILISTIFM